jgi:hypothetical protein
MARLRIFNLLLGALALVASGCAGDEDGAADAASETVSESRVSEAPLDLTGDGPAPPEARLDGPPTGEVPPEVNADVRFGDGPLDAHPADLEDAAPPKDVHVEVEPGPEFDRFCGGKAWDEELHEAVVGKLAGNYVGVYNQFGKYALENMKVIPEHPFWVKKVRVAFGGGSGMATIHLMPMFGRSYPAGSPLVDKPENNLMVPVDLKLKEPKPNDWHEIDVADQGIFLLPTQHYVIVYEHNDFGPFLAVEDLPEGETSRALIIVPSSFEPYGVEGNYRMQLTGSYFCEWAESDRWFGEDKEQPFVAVGNARPVVIDMDGDSHDDLVIQDGGPFLYLGDGKGHFSAPGTQPFPPALPANMAVFGDLDNDGDPDAFLPTWVGHDSDGDKVTILEGDCNDADAAIGPDKEEIAGNLKDDDCDLVADDGTDEGDADQDGWSVAAGDCNDALATASPGMEELLDSVDNDCDGLVDEDFANSIWINEGSDGFVKVEESGVETLDPTGAAALGDGNGDGFLDVYWGNWLEHYPDPESVEDRYAVGNGDGTFVDVTEAAGLWEKDPNPCYGVTWADFNNDGWQDIWVGNYQLNPNYLYQNKGNGTFVDMAPALNADQDDLGEWGGHSYGGDFGDFDNDGDMDLFVPNLAHPRTMPYSDPSQFLVNQGEPKFDFVDKREEFGIIYDEGDVNAAFGDFDNDMDLDLYVSTLYPTHYSKFYRNDGEAGFTDITYESATAVHDCIGAVWADVDEDGDLDLLVSDRHGAQRVQLFVNRVGQEQGWVELLLEGTTTNRGAVGARVSLTAGGVSMMREVKGGGRHSNAQDSAVVHFGLGKAATIDKLSVRWAGGEAEEVAGAAPGKRFKIVEGTGLAVALP